MFSLFQNEPFIFRDAYPTSYLRLEKRKQTLALGPNNEPLKEKFRFFEVGLDEVLGQCVGQPLPFALHCRTYFYVLYHSSCETFSLGEAFIVPFWWLHGCEINESQCGISVDNSHLE